MLTPSVTEQLASALQLILGRAERGGWAAHPDDARALAVGAQALENYHSAVCNACCGMREEAERMVGG